MPVSMYDVSVPVFLRGLGRMHHLLDKLDAFSAEKGLAHGDLLGARLAPDMHPFTRQIQAVSDTSKGAIARLSGQQPPSMPDTETSVAELRERVAKTEDFIKSVSRDAIDGSEAREIVLKVGPNELKFEGLGYLTVFALPNFYFHVTTAYDILRNQGVQIGKRDYLGPLG
ncbi:DUF1993 domain-containing protein [Radicibacter daui]|uniref:DUF1993 domain-containing protein n=1 Tax=Radicibacter daui TaxID=3064829 RepID=UPI004046B108